MEDSDELSRLLKRLEKTLGNRDHPLRRLRAVIAALEAAGLLDILRGWILAELVRIEGCANDVNDSIDRLANRIVECT